MAAAGVRLLGKCSRHVSSIRYGKSFCRSVCVGSRHSS
jgi:hypothetical protein